MMSCESNRRSIVLMIYGELAEGERRVLEQHVRGCDACADSVVEERRLALLLESGTAAEPPADLLERCRTDLHATLRAGPSGGAAPAERAGESAPSPRERWLGQAAWSRRFRLSPAWGLALLACGFLAGRAVPGGPGLNPGRGQATTSDDGATIANVDFRDSDPDSGRVRLTFDTLRRTALEGTASDPRIRSVLVDTVRDNLNAGLRLEAIDVLRRHADDRDVRRALLRAVREDDNPGARLKALEALQERAGDDPEVRGVIVQALLRDTNPGVRVRAIDALQGARGPETLPVLKRLAEQDPNEYVRLRSAALVSQMLTPESGR